MKTTPLIVAAAFVASAVAVPVAALPPPGNWSLTFEYLTTSYFDFKDGVGIYDSGDVNNTFSACVLKLLGLRAIQPIAETWEVDQNMGTNLNGPAIGISDLNMSKGKGGAIDTTIRSLPELGGANGTIFVTFHGMNWRSYEADSSANLFLCTQKVFASSSPGCLAFPSPLMRLWASACLWDEARFGANYLDDKGKYFNGEPFDTLRWKSDVIKCGPNNYSWTRTVNYTDTIQDFTAGGASQTFDLIKNEAVVHGGGKPTETNPIKYGKEIGSCPTPMDPDASCTISNTSYMAVCWQIEYLNFSNPLAPTLGLAQTHDWKLIKDIQGFLKDLYNLAKLESDPQGYIQNLIAHLEKWLEVLDRHYGGGQPDDNSVGGPTAALRGFYSQDSGDPKDADGQNGFPCKPPIIHHSVKAKKPSPIL